MTASEIWRLRAATAFLWKRYGRRGMVHVATLGDELHDVPVAERLTELARFRRYLATYSARAPTAARRSKPHPAHFVVVTEASIRDPASPRGARLPSLHWHIVFALNPAFLPSLQGSFAPYMRDSDAALTTMASHGELWRWTDYLSKERIPQASDATGLPRIGSTGSARARVKGSHRLPEGVRPSRVVPSQALRRDATAIDRMKPYTARNARPKVRKPKPLPEAIRPEASQPAHHLALAGQAELFPELARPVARLDALARGYLPETVRMEIDTRRRRHGLSITELARRAGIRRPQLSNALAGRDPLSAFALARIRETLDASASAPLAA